MHRVTVAGGVAAAAAFTLLAHAPASAAAIPYTTTTHTTSAGIALAGAATAVVEAEGLRMTTPDVPGKVDFKVQVTNDERFVPLCNNIDELSYRTIKYDTVAPAVAPAYKLEILWNASAEVPEDTYTTLVFEPYLQGSGNPPAAATTWDVDAVDFWSSRVIDAGYGNNHSQLKDLDQLCDDYPNAVVLSYGVGQGSSNAGADANADELKFAASSFPIPEPPSLTAAATAAPAATTDDGSEPIADRHIWRAPPQLPKTGIDVMRYVLAGAALLALGTIAVFVARRRRTA